MNTAFALERARNQQADWALTFHIASPPNPTVTVSLLDVRRGLEFHDSASYEQGKLGRGIVRTSAKLMRKALAESERR